MYKTEVEVRKTVKELITVEMDKDMDSVNVYIRNAVDGCIVNEAGIVISSEGFFDLAYPILRAKGYTLLSMPEAV